MVVHQQNLAPEPRAATPSLRELVIALTHNRLPHRDVEFAECALKFIACKDRVSELELPLLKAALTEATLCSQASTMQTNLANVPTDLPTARFSATLAKSELKQLRTNNDRWETRVLDLSSRVDNKRLQLTVAQFSASSAVLESLCCEQLTCKRTGQSFDASP